MVSGVEDLERLNAVNDLMRATEDYVASQFTKLSPELTAAYEKAYDLACEVIPRTEAAEMVSKIYNLVVAEMKEDESNVE